MTNRNEIKKLLDMGFGPLPIPYAHKKAVIKGWPTLKITQKNFDEYFPKGTKQNVGILNGAPSGNIIDIDIDHMTALYFAQIYLPKTCMIFGRKTKPKSHWIYKCTPLPETQKFGSKKHGMIIELRSTGSQTVFPPSTHESGEKIEFFEFGDPTTVKKEDLEKACKIILIATILVEEYPEEGVRNDFALSLCSLALRLFEMDISEAKKFVSAVALQAGDSESKARANIVDYTAKRIAAGDEVQGIPSLKKYISDESINDIAKYIKEANSDLLCAITELNKNYAFCIVPPQSIIIKETMHDNGQITFDFLQIGTFRNEHASRHHGDKKLTTAWLESPLRRSYDGIEFAPSKPTKNLYNLFQGFAVKPQKGDCSLFLSHLKNVLCNGNEEYYNYLIAWLAHLFQKPEDKIGTAIVIRGKQGTGKSVVFKAIGALLGKHYKVADNPRYIAGNFNSHLHDCLLLHLEEAFFAGDGKLEASLKEMITGDTVLMEYKGKEPIIAKNYARVAITTNADWVVPAGMEERRFFVLQASEEYMQNAEYFIALHQELENGGYAALIHFLLHHDYSSVNLRQIPMTEALLDQKINSLNHHEKWWLDLLMEGVLPNQNGWSGVCGTKDIFEDYLKHAGASGTRYKSISTMIGTFLKKTVPNLQKMKGAYDVESSFDGTDKERGNYYTFPRV